MKNIHILVVNVVSPYLLTLSGVSESKAPFMNKKAKNIIPQKTISKTAAILKTYL
jgi:hypothetical protein